MLGAQMSLQKIGFWLTAATLGTLLPARALLAADMPVKARPPAPAYYDWSGVYVGVHAGYGDGMTDWNDQGFDFAARGFLGGGQVGINKQIASLVFGLELDGSWANFNGSQTFSFGGPIIGFQSIGSATSKIDGFVTLAGRAGLAADLVAFDPVTVRSEATFETPNRYSTGFRYVAVNGVLVVDDGKLTGKTPGQPLRGPGYRQR